jgi:hypothetical protein
VLEMKRGLKPAGRFPENYMPYWGRIDIMYARSMDGRGGVLAHFA